MVSRDQRYTRERPCPICGGHDRLPRGDGRRCHGYLSDDGRFARCAREERAGGLPPESATGLYVHRLAGECRCGVLHGPQPDPGGRVDGARRRIIATYDYADEAARLLYQTVRYAPKDFRQRRPDGRGGWLWNLDGTRRVLYRLPELLAAVPAETIHVEEGEKDVETARGLGLVATCNVGGAGKWRDEYRAPFGGRRVAIFPHNDEPGRRHAEQVARSLHGVAASVKIVPLPGLAEHGDFSDWVAAGGTSEALAALVAAAPEWAPQAGAEDGTPAATQCPPEAAPFPVEALPAIPRRFVIEGAAALDVPPEFIAVPLLVFAGGTIGHRYCLRLKKGHDEWGILYAAVIGPPGCGKSPALNLAREPVKRLQDEAWARYHEEMNDYKRALAAWEKTPPAERDERPIVPTLAHYLTADATVESLGVALQTSPGMTYFRDELVAWVKSCDAYRGGKGGDRQKWLSGWSKDLWKIDRKKAEPIYVPNPVIGVVGGIQPDVLGELKHEAGARDGFIERLLLSYPDEHFPDDTDAEVADAALDAMYRIFKALRPCEMTEPDEASIPLTLSADARSLWKGWRRDNTRLLREARGLVQGIYAKLPSQAARLALILHCLTYPEAPERRPVDATTMHAALEVVEYFRAHAKRVLPRFDPDAAAGGGSLVGKVARILDAAGAAWVARSKIRDELHRNVPADAVGEALARLEEQGRAESRINHETGGRPSEEWRATTEAARAGDREEREWTL